MSRVLKSIVVAAVIVSVAAVEAAAQETRIRQQHKIVVPHEVLVELHRVAREAVGEDVLREVTRDLSREIGRAFRDLPHMSGIAAADVQSRDFRAEQTDRQTRTLAIGATGALVLKNVIGDITVKTGGSREATVEIVRVSRGRTDADAKLGLERVTTEVTTRGDQGSVTVRYPEDRRPAYSVSVAYNVTTPAGTRLEIHTITGDVSVAGLKGEMSANTVSGGVQVTQAGAPVSAHTVTGKIVISDAQTDGAIEAGTVNGTVQLTNIKAKRLEASAVSGQITAHQIQAGSADVNTMAGQIEYVGAVAAGGRYEFQAHSGQIRLALTGDFEFEGQTFAGSVDADPSLGLPPPTGRRQSVRGTVGKGGATVEATTFSGSVKVGRKLN